MTIAIGIGRNSKFKTTGNATDREAFASRLLAFPGIFVYKGAIRVI